MGSHDAKLPRNHDHRVRCYSLRFRLQFRFHRIIKLQIVIEIYYLLEADLMFIILFRTLLYRHADGSVKFWDASVATLQVLYKVKTAKVFEKSKCRLPDSDDDPFAIQHIQLCLESRLLVVAGITHVILFRFSKQESSSIDPTVRNTIL